MDDPFPDIERNKTVIRLEKCPSCGRNNTVRLNRSNRAFWACKWPTGDDGHQCRAERRYSDKETVEIMHRYNQDKLKMKGPKDEPQTDEPDAATAAKRSGSGIYDFYRD